MIVRWMNAQGRGESSMVVDGDLRVDDLVITESRDTGFFIKVAEPTLTLIVDRISDDEISIAAEPR